MSVLVMRPYQTNHIVFLVWETDGGRPEEDAREVQAFDAKEAAEDYAEETDRGGDYTVIGGAEMTVLVRRKDDPDAEPKRFVVTGETVPQYSAREQ